MLQDIVNTLKELVSDTYWYLTGIPDLLAVAAKRLEQAASRSTEEPS
jgi:hypothetical protein